MFPTAPTQFLAGMVLTAAVVVSSVGLTILWILFAATLALTTVVAVHRAIPRRERLPRAAHHGPRRERR